MPTTTNFGWTTPADTDLVKDGASAMRTLANGIDTSLAQLKGGTTGQILSKTSNTDMAFTWVTPNPGDITAVNVSSPITGGGSSGDVTISIQDASTTQKGAVQLTDSTASTSTTTAATPNSVKTAYDLANGAIQKTLTTTTGDLIYASSANTPARLGIGSSGQVLTVSGGVPAWATPAGGGGKVLQVVAGTYSTSTTISGNTVGDTGLSVSITPSATTSKILVISTTQLKIARSGSPDTWGRARLVRGSTNILMDDSQAFGHYVQGQLSQLITLTYLDSPSTTSSVTYKAQFGGDASATSVTCQDAGNTSSLILMEIGA